MKRWSEQEIEYVKRLASLGITYTEMSDLLGRTPKSIQEKMKKLKFVFSDFYKKPEKPLCLNCNNDILNSGKIFCSQSCAASYNNLNRLSKKDDVLCENCGNKMRNKKGSKFCSKQCDIEYKSKERQYLVLKDDNSLPAKAYKKYLIEVNGAKCMDCGWDKINPITNKCPIELEHIDGDHTNNHLNNLKLICPNCHSLTPTYKALNKGNGRFNRMKRYYNEQSY